MRFLFMIAVLCFSITSHAQSVRRLFQDVKLPTQGVIEQQSFTDLLAASTTRIVTTTAGATSAAAATLTTFTAQPDSARNIVITPAGTTTDIENCIITVTGTNIFDRTITETFTFAANDTGAQTGAEAFKTVTSVAWPANCESGGFAATWSIGIGEKIGLKRCMAEAGAFVQSSLNGAKEGTAATVVADADEVEKNTADFNGAMNGSNDHKAYFIQNYGCFP